MRRNYPKEAVPLGTLVRSKSLDRLGVVTDAFFDEDDLLIYSCFFIPNTTPGMYFRNLMDVGDELHGIILEESEFDLIFYLMMGTVNLDELNIFHIAGELVI